MKGMQASFFSPEMVLLGISAFKYLVSLNSGVCGLPWMAGYAAQESSGSNRLDLYHIIGHLSVLDIEL